MRKRKLWAGALVLCLICMSAMPAAAGVCEYAKPDFDGYLVCLKAPQDIRLFSIDPDIEPLCEEIGLYHVQSAEAVAALTEAGQVLYSEPNGYVTLFDTPNDPAYDQQWDLEALNVSMARDWELDGTGVRIGVIDSGLNTEHEDLKGASIVGGYNYADNNEDISDELGHGTFTTGVIAAQCDNGKGIAGIAEGAEIVVLKAFNADGGSYSSIIRAIKDAVDVYDCNVLNMSWGVAANVESLKSMIDYAYDAGTVLVASVGNYYGTTLYYPAGYDNVIGVGAVDSNKVHASFSQYNASVTLAAPGSDLYGLDGNGGYKTGGGTSYACPEIVALAALLLQADPDLSPAEVTSVLTSAAEDLGEIGWDNKYGYGFVTVPNMLKELAARNPLYVEYGETTFTVLGCSGLLENPEANAAVACYNQAGKLLQYSPLTYALLMEETFLMPESMAYGKIFFTDEYWKPLMPAWPIE